mmetsp:Transcript_34715/g.83899  ORF Transcript_34715/g.83899 Transcript_34715/m.83899 type:complete len:119 (+) Transcript_34715:317-673(+)
MTSTKQCVHVRWRWMLGVMIADPHKTKRFASNETDEENTKEVIFHIGIRYLKVRGYRYYKRFANPSKLPAPNDDELRFALDLFPFPVPSSSAEEELHAPIIPQNDTINTATNNTSNPP